VSAGDEKQLLEIQSRYQELMIKHHDVFSKNDQDIGKAFGT
jgi:hypothetical protein